MFEQISKLVENFKTEEYQSDDSIKNLIINSNLDSDSDDEIIDNIIKNKGSDNDSCNDTSDTESDNDSEDNDSTKDSTKDSNKGKCVKSDTKVVANLIKVEPDNESTHNSDNEEEDEEDEEDEEEVEEVEEVEETVVESDNESEESEIECEEIKSRSGESYALDQKTNIVYSIEDTEELGTYTAVEYNKAPFENNGIYYIIAKEHEYKNKTYIKCIISDLLFHNTNKRSFIGTIVKNKSGVEKLIRDK